ncbi:hypothetical protein Emag_001923 [Eimeria magna]
MPNQGRLPPPVLRAIAESALHWVRCRSHSAQCLKPYVLRTLVMLRRTLALFALGICSFMGLLTLQFRGEKYRNQILHSREQMADVLDTLLRQSTNLQLAVFSDSTKIVEQQLASMLNSMRALVASLPMLPAKALEAILRTLAATDALARDYLPPSARAMEGALLGFACLAAAEFQTRRSCCLQIPITQGLLSGGLPKCLALPATAALTPLEKRVLLHSWLSSCVLASSTCASCPDQATQLLEGLSPPAWAFENRSAEGKMLPPLLGALLQSSSADIELFVQRLFDTARSLVKSRTEKDGSSLLGLAGILLSIALKRLVRQADWTKSFDIDDLIMEAENLLEAADPSTAAGLHEAANAVAFTYTRNAEPLVDWLCSRKPIVPVAVANKTAAADTSEKMSIEDATLQAQQIHAQGEEFERSVQSSQVAVLTSTDREAALWIADCFSILLAPPLQAVSAHHRTISASSFSTEDKARPCGLFNFERIAENAVLLAERKEPDTEEILSETIESLQTAATSSNRRDATPAFTKTPSRSGVSPLPTGSGAPAPRIGVKSDKGGDESRAECESPYSADLSLCAALQALLQRGAAAASRAVLAGAPLLAHSVIMQLGTALLVAERSVDPLSVCLKSPSDGLTDERKPLSETAIAGRTPASKEFAASGMRETAKTDGFPNSKAGKKGDSRGHVRSPGAPSVGGPTVRGSRQQVFEGKLPTSPWVAAGMVAHTCVELLRLLVSSYLRVVDKSLCRRFSRYAKGPALRCALSLALVAQQKIISAKEKALQEAASRRRATRQPDSKAELTSSAAMGAAEETARLASEAMTFWAERETAMSASIIRQKHVEKWLRAQISHANLEVMPSDSLLKNLKRAREELWEAKQSGCDKLVLEQLLHKSLTQHQRAVTTLRKQQQFEQLFTVLLHLGSLSWIGEKTDLADRSWREAVEACFSSRNILKEWIHLAPDFFISSEAQVDIRLRSFLPLHRWASLVQRRSHHEQLHAALLASRILEGILLATADLPFPTGGPSGTATSIQFFAARSDGGLVRYRMRQLYGRRRLLQTSFLSPGADENGIAPAHLIEALLWFACLLRCCEFTRAKAFPLLSVAEYVAGDVCRNIQLATHCRIVRTLLCIDPLVELYGMKNARRFTLAKVKWMLTLRSTLSAPHLQDSDRSAAVVHNGVRAWQRVTNLLLRQGKFSAAVTVATHLLKQACGWGHESFGQSRWPESKEQQSADVLEIPAHPEETHWFPEPPAAAGVLEYNRAGKDGICAPGAVVELLVALAKAQIALGHPLKALLLCKWARHYARESKVDKGLGFADASLIASQILADCPDLLSVARLNDAEVRRNCRSTEEAPTRAAEPEPEAEERSQLVIKLRCEALQRAEDYSNDAMFHEKDSTARADHSQSIHQVLQRVLAEAIHDKETSEDADESKANYDNPIIDVWQPSALPQLHQLRGCNVENICSEDPNGDELDQDYTNRHDPCAHQKVALRLEIAEALQHRKGKAAEYSILIESAASIVRTIGEPSSILCARLWIHQLRIFRLNMERQLVRTKEEDLATHAEACGKTDFEKAPDILMTEQLLRYFWMVLLAATFVETFCRNDRHLQKSLFTEAVIFSIQILAAPCQLLLKSAFTTALVSRAHNEGLDLVKKAVLGGLQFCISALQQLGQQQRQAGPRPDAPELNSLLDSPQVAKPLARLFLALRDWDMDSAGIDETNSEEKYVVCQPASTSWFDANFLVALVWPLVSYASDFLTYGTALRVLEGAIRRCEVLGSWVSADEQLANCLHLILFSSSPSMQSHLSCFSDLSSNAFASTLKMAMESDEKARKDGNVSDGASGKKDTKKENKVPPQEDPCSTPAETQHDLLHKALAVLRTESSAVRLLWLPPGAVTAESMRLLHASLSAACDSRGRLQDAGKPAARRATVTSTTGRGNFTLSLGETANNLGRKATEKAILPQEDAAVLLAIFSGSQFVGSNENLGHRPQNDAPSVVVCVRTCSRQKMQALGTACHSLSIAVRNEMRAKRHRTGHLPSSVQTDGGPLDTRILNVFARLFAALNEGRRDSAVAQEEAAAFELPAAGRSPAFGGKPIAAALETPGDSAKHATGVLAPSVLIISEAEAAEDQRTIKANHAECAEREGVQVSASLDFFSSFLGRGSSAVECKQPPVVKFLYAALQGHRIVEFEETHE